VIADWDVISCDLLLKISELVDALPDAFGGTEHPAEIDTGANFDMTYGS
jgi:hypothetical protein